MTHTPTPLKLSETFDHRPAIMDATGQNIASWDPATREIDMTTTHLLSTYNYFPSNTWLVFDKIDGVIVDRIYHNCTRNEAIRRFKKDIK